ncbi:Kelch repeat-containing protein [Carboxylicivirga linearis]|uniref:Attractin/MKLN-like beta-propeller domain-containing protein n=1 Tax=Carboxylicivirga linearis TaxID=1628157 RepID=A0ABS5JV24_9BACT|nr:kelch repeat-containing protein [Carboxylicivirga linearis]MBS2098747.1 hypothetical protein [Carboxylicivirga linearis]
MKKLLSAVLLFITIIAVGQQSAPQHFNYQTLIRNTDGTYVSNADVYIKISIVQDAPDGDLVYNEVQQATTNDYGLINLKIGEGITNDDFSSIEWGSAQMFVKVEASIGNEQNYFEVGVNPFSSVPYALFAEKTGTDYKVPTGTGILSFNTESPDGYGFTGNKITTTRQEGIWSEESSFVNGRRYPVVCATDTEIYVMGGESQSDFTSALFEAYNLNDNTWSVKTDLPLGRVHAAATYLNGKVYVAGGFKSGSNTAVVDVDVYDPATDTWSTIASMNNGRWGLSLVAFNNKLYAIGGLADLSSTNVTNIEEYDFNTDTWSIVAEIPYTLIGAKATIYNGKIYIGNGRESMSGSKPINNFMVTYDIDTKEWELLPAMNQGRVSYAIGVINNRVVVAGGFDNENFVSSTETYDPITKTWFIEGDLSKIKAGLTGVTVNNDFWVFGGHNSDLKLNDAEKLIMKTVSEDMYIHVSE